MKITYIAITLLFLLNFTNTKIRFIGLKNRLRLFRIRRFLSPLQLARLYLFYNRKTRDLQVSDLRSIIIEGEEGLIESEGDLSESSESSEIESESESSESIFAFLRRSDK